jgi:hypothetical protein
MNDYMFVTNSLIQGIATLQTDSAIKKEISLKNKTLFLQCLFFRRIWQTFSSTHYRKKELVIKQCLLLAVDILSKF